MLSMANRRSSFSCLFSAITAILLLTVVVPKHSNAQPIQDEKRPFKVESYKITLDWRLPFTKHSFRYPASSTMHVAMTSDSSVLKLDASLMRIDTLTIDGQAISPIPQPDQNEHLNIPLPAALQKQGSSFDVHLAWTRTSDADLGFYFYTKGTYVGKGQVGDSVFVDQDIAYTMGEPLEAHKWMPCLDQPSNKATSEITIIVPQPYSAQSNGILESVKMLSDSSRAYHWVADKPITSYLMVADASNFIQWENYYHNPSNPSDSVRLIYYAWPSDYNETEVTDGSKYNAQYAMRNTPKMMEVLSEHFGHFPFAQYGQVPVQPFAFGGMEHQGMTTITRTWFRGHSDDGIEHEMTHQWFGDKTTCATWKDVWMNESFASFGECIWEEAINGRTAYQNHVNSFASNYFQDASDSIPIYAPPASDPLKYGTVYCKGACVIHILRDQLHNDTLFYNSLRDYSSNFAYQSATTAQMRDFLSTRMQRDLTTFFDQWIYGPGNPDYTITWAQGADTTLVMQIQQVQTAQDHFSLDLPIVLRYSLGGSDTIRVSNTERSQLYRIPLKKKLSSILLDENAIVLATSKVTKNATLSVGEIAEQQTFRLHTTDNKTLSTVPVASSSVSNITLYDMLGREVKSYEVHAGVDELAISTQALSNGTYLVKLRNGTTVLASAKFTVTK